MRSRGVEGNGWGHRLALAAAVIGIVGSGLAGAQAPQHIKRVLLFDQELGHGDVKQMLRTFLTNLAIEKGFDLDTADGATRNKMGYASLKNYQVVVWGSNEGGDPVLPEGELQNGFQRWVEEGGGYIAFHSGTGLGTLSWPWQFACMIQPYQADQGQGINARAHLYDNTAPDYNLYPHAVHTQKMLAGLPDPGTLVDEWYSVVADPRKSIRLQVQQPNQFQAAWGAESYGLKKVWALLWVDGDSWTRGGTVRPSVYIGRFHPVAWAHMAGQGATIQMTMGHQVNPGFFAQSNNFGKEFMWRAIRWAGKDCEYWKGQTPSCPTTAVEPLRMEVDQGKLSVAGGSGSRSTAWTVRVTGGDRHELAVTDVRGQAVLRGSGNGSRTYDLARLPKGIYYVKASSGSTRLSQKIVRM